MLHMRSIFALTDKQRLASAAAHVLTDVTSMHAQVSALMRQVLSELAQGAGRQRSKLLLDAFKQTDERRRAQFAEVTNHFGLSPKCPVARHMVMTNTIYNPVLHARVKRAHSIVRCYYPSCWARTSCAQRRW